ncbi:hypothetical protein WMF31_11545 [Sorangium sp. So ce1036]|uniref:hypothetical protein n=1 Tax=Sorangium sp. So ce1036 TaxID=3133328 RepID=UPI003EFD61FE
MIARRRLTCSWARAVMASLALFGCVDDAGSGPQGGQIGGVYTEGGRCEDQKQPIGEADVSPLGFSASEVLASIAGERTAPLTWANGGSTTVTVLVGAPTAVRFVESTRVEDSDPSGVEPAFAVDCSDHLEIDVPLSFATADGAFAESLQVTLRATEAGTARFHHEFDLAALEGSYEVTEVDPSAYKEVSVYLRGTIGESAVTGEIDGTAESHPSGSGPDATVSATLFEVATF